MMSLTAFADELEREKARQRTYDAMLRKAQGRSRHRRPRVRVRQRRDRDADGTRSHVERRINEAEADGRPATSSHAVRRRRRAPRRSRKPLNAKARRAPRAQQGRPSGWAPSSVREVLHRPLYRGDDRLEPDAEARYVGPAAATDRPAERLAAACRRRISGSSSETLWRGRARAADASGDATCARADGQLSGEPAERRRSQVSADRASRTCGLCGGWR